MRDFPDQATNAGLRTQCGHSLVFLRVVVGTLRVYWLPPRDSNPDMLIQSQLSCR